MGAPLNKDLSLKCLRFHMNSEIFLLDKKLDEIIKKLRKKKTSGSLTTLRKQL